MSPFDRLLSPAPGRRHAPDCFESFELEIEKTRGQYQARVAASPMTKTRAFPVPLEGFDPERLGLATEKVGARGSGERHARVVESRHRDLQSWGKDLFRATFVGDLRKVLESSIQKVRSEGKGLRICLRLDDAPELAALPWETLGDALDDGEFGGDLDLLVTRTLNVSRFRRPRAEVDRKKVRMLGLLPSPAGEEELSGKEEWEELVRLLNDGIAAGALETCLVDPPTLEELGQEIDRAPCQILHVVAHGEPGEPGASGSLLLESSSGDVDSVGGLQLRQALASREPPRLVVLNACFGAAACSEDAFDGLAQSLLRAGVRAVVAMRTAISDGAALDFAEVLYSHLVQGRTLEAAMCEARRALALGEHRSEWATPVLYLQGENQRILDDEWLASLGRLRRFGLGAALCALLAIGGYQVTRQPPPGTPCPVPGPAGLGLELMWIEAGQPSHSVDELGVEDSFCISAKEVTRQQWLEVLKGEVPKDMEGLNLPITDITLDQVGEFANLLGRRDSGATYRLPTEREWEYAARAGKGTDYWFGDGPEELFRYGNCRNDDQDGYDKLAPVGSFPPNPWGLYDVHGNAAEWVQPVTLAKEGGKVRLGGSADNVPGNCDFNFRREISGNSDKWTGFRIVRELSAEEQAAQSGQDAPAEPNMKEGR